MTTAPEKRHHFSQISRSGIYNSPNSSMDFNLLNPTGHVMHKQFNIQQLYALPTL